MRRANLTKFTITEKELFDIVLNWIYKRAPELEGKHVNLKFAESKELLVYFVLDEEVLS